MDFQNMPHSTVIDPVQFFGIRAIGRFSFHFFLNGFLQEIDCDLLERGVTRERAENFNHPYPFFSRLFVFRKGSAQIQTDTRSETLVPGSVYLLPSGMPFSIHYTDRELFYFHLRIREHSGRSIFQKEDPLFCIPSPELADRIIRTCETENLIAQEAVLLETLSEILPGMETALLERARASSEFSPIFQYLETHPIASVGIKELAELYNIEAAALSKRFRRKMKTPLKKFLVEHQLLRACELLLYSNWPHREIASTLGYSDVSYFYRFFREHTGRTPREFQLQKRTATPQK